MTSANFGVVTTTVIEVWNVELTGTQLSTSPTFQVTSSVLPPPFTITDDPNPESQAGVSHPPVTRIITPPPYPYSQTAPDPHFPSVTFKHGPPLAQCKIGCGTHCLIFCSHPCLIGCGPGGGSDFPDPINPNPPNNPNKANEQSSSDCTTRTASSCGVQCNANPSSCSTTCSTTSGCSVTDTTDSVTITTAPVVDWGNEVWPTTIVSDQTSDANAILDSEFPGWRSDGGVSRTGPPSAPTSTMGKPQPPSSPSSVGPPPPPPPSPPEATCRAVANLANTNVGVWTDFITDDGAALQSDIKRICVGAQFSAWSVTTVSVPFTRGRTTWTANRLFQFSLFVRAPAQVSCVQRAIVAAGGPSDTPACDFVAFLNPP